MAVKIQLRRGTTSQWNATVDSIVGGTILSAGEVGVNTTTKQMKVGDGSTRWVSLPYFASGTITSVTAGDGITVYTTAGSSASSGAISVAVDTNYVMARNIVNAKGDLIVGSANDTPSILTVGATANHVLLVDSTTATGVKWGAVPTLNQNTTGTAANVTGITNATLTTLSALTSIGTSTITTGTWSANIGSQGVNGAVSGAYLTNLNADNLSSGTVSASLMPSVMYTTNGAASTKKITIQDGGPLPANSLLDGDICFIY
jgi:hypothetical protein